MKIDRNPIVIVGMQRSGTSALAGALQKLGVFFGKEEMLYAADANNSQGFFEHRKATILNLRCLDEFGMHPTSVGTMPSAWQNYPQAASLKAELKQFLKDEFAGRGRWAIKQPLTSLVMPLYNSVFAAEGIQPHYVLCVRNPLESMRSESKLDFGDSYRVMAPLGKRAIGSWLRYTLGAFADVNGHRLTVVAYEDLLEEPEKQLRRIAGGHPEWSPSPEAFYSAASSIRPELRRNQSTLEDLSAFPRIVRETYEQASKLSEGDSDAWSAMNGLHAEFRSWVQVLAAPGPPASKLGLAWVAEGKRHIAEAAYVPALDWQSLQMTIDAPPKTLVSGLIYGLPCRVSIRRSVWRRNGTEAPAPMRCGLGSRLAFVGGVHRLDAVFEPDQVQFVTPGGPGPYELSLEFLLEVGPAIASTAAARLAGQLEACVESVEQLRRRTLPAGFKERS